MTSMMGQTTKDLSSEGSGGSISQDEVWPRREETNRGIQKPVIGQVNCRFRKTGYTATLQSDPKNAT